MLPLIHLSFACNTLIEDTTMSPFWLDQSTIEIIAIGAFALFVVYPIVIKFLLGVFSLTEDSEKSLEKKSENSEKEKDR